MESYSEGLVERVGVPRFERLRFELANTERKAFLRGDVPAWKAEIETYSVVELAVSYTDNTGFPLRDAWYTLLMFNRSFPKQSVRL